MIAYKIYFETSLLELLASKGFYSIHSFKFPLINVWQKPWANWASIPVYRRGDNFIGGKGNFNCQDLCCRRVVKHDCNTRKNQLKRCFHKNKSPSFAPGDTRNALKAGSFYRYKLKPSPIKLHSRFFDQLFRYHSAFRIFACCLGSNYAKPFVLMKTSFPYGINQPHRNAQ